MWKYAGGSSVVVLIRSISQCFGDGSHYKHWESYQNQQDLKLEALIWTKRHLQTSASHYQIGDSTQFYFIKPYTKPMELLF